MDFKYSTNEIISLKEKTTLMIDLEANVNIKETYFTIKLPVGDGPEHFMKKVDDPELILSPNPGGNNWGIDDQEYDDGFYKLTILVSDNKFYEGDTKSFGIKNIPTNRENGTTKITITEIDEEGKEHKKILTIKKESAEKKRKIYFFGATQPVIGKGEKPILFWDIVTKDKDEVILHWDYYKNRKRTRSTQDITPPNGKIIKLLPNDLKRGSKKIDELLKEDAIFQLTVREPNAPTERVYEECLIKIRQILILEFRIIKGQANNHIYGTPLELEWEVQFLYANHSENKCWIRHSEHLNDGTHINKDIEIDLPQASSPQEVMKGIYTFYPTYPSKKYTLLIKDGKSGKTGQRDLNLGNKITISPSTPIGSISMYAGTGTIPKGWILCDGKPLTMGTLKGMTDNESLIKASFKGLGGVLTKISEPDEPIIYQVPNLLERFIMGATDENLNKAEEADTHKHKVPPLPEEQKGFYTSKDGKHRHSTNTGGWIVRELANQNSMHYQHGMKLEPPKSRDPNALFSTSDNGKHNHVVLPLKSSTTITEDKGGYPKWYNLAFIMKVLF